MKDNDNGEMNDNDDITVYKFVDDTKALYSIGKGEKLNEFQEKMSPIYKWNINNNMYILE